MAKSAVHWLGVIVAWLIVIATPFAAYQLVKLFVAADSNVKLGVLTASVSVLALIYNNARQQNREISTRHFSEKRAAYQKIFDFIFEHLGAQNDNFIPDTSIERVKEIMKSIMMWGSAETISAYNDFMRLVTTETASGESSDFPVMHFQKIEKLLLCMRNDLGHNDSKLSKFSLIKLFIRGDEHYKFD